MPWCLAVLAVALAVTAPAAAHIPFLEPELVDPSNGADWSLEAPFQIPLSAADGYTATLNTSRALLSVLGASPGDLYDAAAFNVSAGGPPQTVEGLYALAPGCAAFADFYPAVALLGPLSDPRFKAPPAGAALPFALPAGYGAIVVEQPRVARAVFADGPFVRYFLPGPLADWQRCITSAAGFRACDPRNEGSLTMEQPLAPGRYYIAWWDPDRTTAAAPAPPFPREVTINVGFAEEATPEEQQLQREVMTGEVRPAFAQCLAGAVGPGAEPGGPAPAPGPAPGQAEGPAASGAGGTGGVLAGLLAPLLLLLLL